MYSLRRYWLALWGGVAVGLTVFSLAATSSASHNYSSAQQRAALQDHFYGVVAGQPPYDSPTVADQLAEDIRAKLGRIDPEARSLPAAIESFRGDPNVYGGVSVSLGIDPFTSSDCAECGPLTSTVKAKLLQVKQGRLDQVIAEETPHKPAFNPGWYAALLWLVGGAGAWLAARTRAARKLHSDYPQESYLIGQLKNVLQTIPDDDEHFEQRQQTLELLSQLKAVTRGSESLHAQNITEQAQELLRARKAADKEVQELTR